MRGSDSVEEEMVAVVALEVGTEVTGTVGVVLAVVKVVVAGVTQTISRPGASFHSF